MARSVIPQFISVNLLQKQIASNPANLRKLPPVERAEIEKSSAFQAATLDPHIVK